MSPSATPSDSTRSNFLTIPVEIRTMIYRMVIAGSRVTFTPKWSRRSTQPVRRRAGDPFTTQGDTAILRACKQCLAEAHGIFWSETVVSVNPTPRYIWRGFGVFCDQLSGFAKSHIRHLRGVEVPKQPQTLSAILAPFPRLTTCECLVRPDDWVRYNGNICLDELDDPGLYSEVVREFVRMDPHSFLEKQGCDPARGKTIFLVGFKLVGEDRRGTDWLVSGLINLNSRRLVLKEKRADDDEDS